MQWVNKIFFFVLMLSVLNTASAYNTSLNSTTKMLEIRNDDGSINRTIFPVSMSSMCNQWGTKPPFTNCSNNLLNNSIYPFELAPETYGSYDTYIPIYAQHKIGYTVRSNNIPSNLTTRANPNIWLTYMFAGGTDEPDYSIPSHVSQAKNSYNNSKLIYPNKLVLINNWQNLFEWLGCCADIFALDAYVNTHWGATVYSRSDWLYAQEVLIGNANGLNGNTWKYSGLNNKSVWLILSGLVYPNADTINPLTEQEIRSLAWTGIASGVQGIAYWGYLPYHPNSSTISGFNGLANEINIAQHYTNTSSEIISLNEILIMPTKSIFWNNDKNTSYTNITPNPTKYVYSGTRNKYTYLLKQPSSDLSYLILVNKDVNPGTNIQIWVGGMGGTKTVRLLGNKTTGSGRSTASDPTRILTATDGKFNDSIDGYAVHIYKITSTNKSPSITSWNNSKTNDNSISLNLNTSESVTFNATANQTIDNWDWFKDDVSQIRNSNNFTTNFSARNHTIKVNAANANGTSNTIVWTVTVPIVYGAPNITSWSNNKTNNVNTTLTVNISETIRFTATANQTITTWNWYKDDVLAGNTTSSYTSSYTTSWSSIGTKTIKVSGTNANGTSNTITRTITVLPTASPKFGVGGNAWDSVGTSSNVYIENDILKLGFWGENFDNGLYDWTTESGDIGVSNGKLLMSGSTYGHAAKIIGNHSDVAFFAEWNEPIATGFRAFAIRSDTSRASPDMNYWASARPDGSGMWIVKYNGTDWVNVNGTGTFARSAGQTSYCIEKGYGSTLKVYCSHTSFAEALSSSPVSHGTDTQFAYGNRIRLEGNGITTFDNLRVIPLDSSGNLINSGSKTIHYDSGANNVTGILIINATTPANTNYTVSYRQKYTGSWIPIGGTYTGNQTLSITGTKYQDTEVNITLFGNGTAFPEIETVEFIREQVTAGNVYPRYDVDENGIVDMDDLKIVGQHFNEIVSIHYPRYDVNMDGLVNIDDITIVGQNFGEKF